jgi:flagellar protein FlgJ
MTPTVPNAGLAGDTRGLAALRAQAAADPKAAIKAAAKQFEALFMRELLKSMREATPTTGLTDNQGSRMGTEMLDGQMAEQVSGGPGSLSALIARQLERQMGLDAGRVTQPPTAGSLVTPATGATPRIPEKGAAAFVQQHTRAAQSAEAASGIPAQFMIAQAAHESGWGRKQILNADGSPSNNLFGIKAGKDWAGPVAEVMTTEYVAGQPRKMVQKFRAYASAAESFADYAKLMKDSPRYQSVLQAGTDARGFAQGLQRAGYATDPAYASKLERVINTTMRLQRALG